MTTDLLLTLLNVAAGVFLTGIGIAMVYMPPGDDRKKKWCYWILFAVLGVTVVVTTVLQSLRTAHSQIAERKQHDTEQGNLEGKLDLMSGVLRNSSCASAAEIGTLVQQELAKQRYERARTPIAEGKLATLSSDLLVGMVPNITKYMRGFRDGWYAESNNQQLMKWEDHVSETSNIENEREHATARLPVSRTQQQWEEIQQRTNNRYRAEFARLLSDAEALRQDLRNKLPKDALTPDDGAEVAVFAKALAEGSAVQSGLDCCPASIEKAAEYLDSLAKRVSRIKTLQN